MASSSDLTQLVQLLDATLDPSHQKKGKQTYPAPVSGCPATGA